MQRGGVFPCLLAVITLVALGAEAGSWAVRRSSDGRTLLPISIKIDLYLGSTTSSGLITVDTLIDPSLGFNPTNPTFFITHGWQDSIKSAWLTSVKDAILTKIPSANVFLVDWSAISQNLLYPLVKSETVYVGAELANFINKNNMDPSQIHLAGHSLGSHVAGVTGYKYYVITGLDPATPLYSNLVTPATDKLDKSDAVFVDTIFTSMAFFRDIIGVEYSVGHVNFFPNGGDSQPGCLDEITLDLTQYLTTPTNEWRSCSHGRAIDLFIDSIIYENLVGYKCSYPDLIDGKCLSTTSNKLGYPASPLNTGNFVLTTRAVTPFANDDFNLAATVISIDVPLGVAPGTLTATLPQSKNMILASPVLPICKGQIIRKLASVPFDAVTEGSTVGIYWSTLSLFASGTLRATISLSTPDNYKTLLLGNPAVLKNGVVSAIVAA